MAAAGSRRPAAAASFKAPGAQRRDPAGAGTSTLGGRPIWGYNLYMMNLPAALMLACLAVSVHAAETDWSRSGDTAGVVQAIAASKEAAPSPKAAPAPVAKMKPETAEFLRSIGVDPESEDVVATEAEGTVATEYDGDPVEYSLDSLAAEKKKNGIVTFIGTRTFIRRLKKDWDGTSIPRTNYDPKFLTRAELGMAGRKFAEQLFKKKYRQE